MSDCFCVSVKHVCHQEDVPKLPQAVTCVACTLPAHARLFCSVHPWLPVLRFTCDTAYSSPRAVIEDASFFLTCELVLQAIAKSFGFSVPPRVTLSLESKSKHTRKANKLMAQLGAKSGKGKEGQPLKSVSGHAFSAANPRGKRDSSDKRQFVRL